jgi:F-type H+-transporting ATPase subunit delta
VRATTVARSYAEALFEIGERHDAHEDFARGFNTVTALLDADPRVRAFLESPKIDISHKRHALRGALAEHVAPLFLNFLLMVLQKRRQRLLRPIAEAYRDRLDEKLGRQHVQVTVAHDPDEATEAAISSELSRILGRAVVPHVRVDPAILGGIVVRTGDRMMDGSLRRRLIALRRRMLEAVAPAGGRHSR